jgi:hypothetical protein
MQEPTTSIWLRIPYRPHTPHAGAVAAFGLVDGVRSHYAPAGVTVLEASKPIKNEWLITLESNTALPPTPPPKLTRVQLLVDPARIEPGASISW